MIMKAQTTQQTKQCVYGNELQERILENLKGIGYEF